MQGFQTLERGACLEETTFLEGVAGSQLEEEGMVVSVSEEVQWVVACPLVVELVAYWGQRVAVQMGVVEEVPSSSQKEVVVASEVAAAHVTLGSEQAQAWGCGTAPPAAPF